jgi:hypothetical protein
MLRLLMILSGGFEALFGLSALLAPGLLISALGAELNSAALFLARVLGAATLGLGIAAVLARNETATTGGLAVAYGLALYNVLAAGVILWTAISQGGAPLWSTGLVHVVIGVLFMISLTR